MPNSIDLAFLKINKNGTLLFIKAVPGSKKTQIGGPLGDRLKIKIQAPPEDGKANKELIQFLSKLLEVPSSHLELINGLTSPLKTILISAAVPIDNIKNKLSKSF